MNAQNSRWNPKVSPIWALVLVPIVFFGLKWWFEDVNRRPYLYQPRVISNLKQLGLATLLYGNDYDNHLPFVHPFEFGIDPLADYCKNDNDLHSNPFPSHLEERKAGTSDYLFHWVLNRRTLLVGKESRLIYDIWQSENTELDVLITSPILVKGDKRGLFTCFGDGHVKWTSQERFVAVLPPQGDFPCAFCLDDLLFTMPEDKSPAKFWAVPYEDVERYAKWAKDGKR